MCVSLLPNSLLLSYSRRHIRSFSSQGNKTKHKKKEKKNIRKCCVQLVSSSFCPVCATLFSSTCVRIVCPSERNSPCQNNWRWLHTEKRNSTSPSAAYFFFSIVQLEAGGKRKAQPDLVKIEPCSKTFPSYFLHFFCLFQHFLIASRSTGHLEICWANRNKPEPVSLSLSISLSLGSHWSRFFYKNFLYYIFEHVF